MAHQTPSDSGNVRNRPHRFSRRITKLSLPTKHAIAMSNPLNVAARRKVTARSGGSTTNKPTRVGVRYLPDGSKELYAKKSGARLRLITKPNPRYAQKA